MRIWHSRMILAISQRQKVGQIKTMNDSPKDLGDETLNSILEELIKMRDYQRKRQKDCIHSDTDYIRHYSAGDAIQRAIDTIVEHANE